MVKTELGEKQVCPSCGAKFYDLRRRPATCPKCTTSFDPSEEGVRTRRGRARVSAQDDAYGDDEDTEVAAKKGDDDDDEEEAEATPEMDAEGDADPAIVGDDDDDGDDSTASAGDELPEGFSEEEADLGDAADDDSVPLLEDEEEFNEDELGEIGGGDDDDSGR